MTVKAITLEGSADRENSAPTCLQNLRNYFNEYCTNTSIHGLKFLGERRRSAVERIWWLIVIVISLFFCTRLISEAYNKWNLSPVVVSFATTETPVWQIPFPAVIICPQIKANKSLIDYTNLLLKKLNHEVLTEKELNQLRLMSSVCSYGRTLFHDSNPRETFDYNEHTRFLMQIRPSLNSTIKHLHWTNKDYITHMDTIFTPIITAEGVCYSFNLIDPRELYTPEVVVDIYDQFSLPHQKSSEWSIENGYPEESKLETYPRRSAVAGGYGGLDITLSFNSSDMDYLCDDALEGYKVIINNPVQRPFVNKIYFQVGVDKDVTVSVTPNVISTSPQLRHYKPYQRKCYFQEEIKLKFFKIYDQQNCFHECLSNFTYEQCGCVTFTMLRDNSTPICGPGKEKCVAKMGIQFLSRQVAKNEKEKVCNNCYPSCNSLDFETEISQCDWNWKEQVRLNQKSDFILNGFKYTNLHIFYNKQQFITSERHELFGQMDFLASCGGLLGLFIGFSFISVMEIVYFLTIRFAYNVKNFGKNYWAGKDNLSANQINL